MFGRRYTFSVQPCLGTAADVMIADHASWLGGILFIFIFIMIASPLPIWFVMNRLWCSVRFRPFQQASSSGSPKYQSSGLIPTADSLGWLVEECMKDRGEGSPDYVGLYSPVVLLSCRRVERGAHAHSGRESEKRRQSSDDSDERQTAKKPEWIG